MKQLLLWLTIISSIQIVRSQDVSFDRKALADSLEQALNNHPSDSLRSRAAYHLAEFWAKEDTAKAKSYLEKGRKLASGSVYMQACYQYYLGKVYMTALPAKSEQAFLKADSIINAHHLKFKPAYKLRSAIWYNYGVLQQIKDDTEGVISIFLEKVIPYTRLAGMHDELPRMYSAVGLFFNNELEYEKAGSYFDEALAMLDTVSVSLEQQADIYSSAVRNLLSLGKFTEARKYQTRVKELLDKHRETNYYLDYLLNETSYFIKKNLLDNALTTISEGIALSEGLDDPFQKESFLNEKFKALFYQEKYEEAKDILLNLAESPTTPFITTKLVYYQNLAEVYEKLGDFKQAYRWLKVYSTNADSLKQADLKAKIFQLETKFQTVESKHEITALQAQKSAAELEARNNRLFNWVLGLGCLALLLVAAVMLAYNRAQKRRAVQLEQQQQLAVTQAMLAGEERERKRIARDLHDGLGGMLAGVKINLSGWAANNLESPQDITFHRVVEQLDSSVSELRRIARNMMPETLLKFGLQTALADLCEFYTESGVNVDFQPFELTKTSSIDVQITIYRIAQELLSNAIRHGKATNVVLQCSQDNHHFLITAEDNGIGFDKAILTHKSGIGLANIKSRVSYYQGEMELITAPGEGTTVHIELHDNGE